jgi:hypothetical protein
VHGDKQANERQDHHEAKESGGSLGHSLIIGFESRNLSEWLARLRKATTFHTPESIRSP